jgi:hypothetical protein
MGNKVLEGFVRGATLLCRDIIVVQEPHRVRATLVLLLEDLNRILQVGTHLCLQLAAAKERFPCCHSALWRAGHEDERPAAGVGIVACLSWAGDCEDTKWLQRLVRPGDGSSRLQHASTAAVMRLHLDCIPVWLQNTSRRDGDQATIVMSGCRILR